MSRTRIRPRKPLADLNEIVPGDGPEWARDDAAHVTAFTRRPLKFLANVLALDRVTHVLGCVAWLTHPDVLAALAKKDGVSLIVQKEEFYRRGSAHSRFSARPMFDRLKPLDRRMVDDLNSEDCMPFQFVESGIQFIQPVRCVGHRDRADVSCPRMHHKFFVLCDTNQHRDLHPFAVTTGSMNPTKNGERSLENVVLIESDVIARQFYWEWMYTLGASEPLDWTSKAAAPEWRDES
jgi:hypothetical protein